MTENLVEIQSLKKYFQINKDVKVKSVDDISFFIRKGETFGLVGESGSGKSAFGKTLVGLHGPSDGNIIYNGQNVTQLNKEMKRNVNKEMQIIFQDPHAF